MQDGIQTNRAWRQFVFRLRTMSPLYKRKIRSALIDAAEIVLTTSKRDYLTATKDPDNPNQTMVKGLAVRTGRLRSSVTRSPPRQVGLTFSITVGTNVNYGRFWEIGDGSGSYMHWFFGRPNRRLKTRPFLKPAINDNKVNIRRRFQKIGVIL